MRTLPMITLLSLSTLSKINFATDRLTSQAMAVTTEDKGLNKKGQPRKRQRIEKSVPMACNECRRRHVKCTGETPCAKCSTKNITCIYTDLQTFGSVKKSGKVPRECERRLREDPNNNHDDQWKCYYLIQRGLFVPKKTASIAPNKTAPIKEEKNIQSNSCQECDQWYSEKNDGKVDSHLDTSKEMCNPHYDSESEAYGYHYLPFQQTGEVPNSDQTMEWQSYHQNSAYIPSQFPQQFSYQQDFTCIPSQFPQQFSYQQDFTCIPLQFPEQSSYQPQSTTRRECGLAVGNR